MILGDYEPILAYIGGVNPVLKNQCSGTAGLNSQVDFRNHLNVNVGNNWSL